ncbi:hypothetical protein CASFOL_003383 [Castilleja foliolosa]|uniref:DUF7733 domain-containing protein n=1 Tax=Castilleja foliolosa TaxID=1961234 RepID=A0ABD3EH07_9LAMI
MSCGIGSSSNTSNLKEEPDLSNAALKTTGKPRSFFTFRQLNVLSIMIVLAASGTVSAADLAFVVFSLIYMYFISRIAFPVTSPCADPPVFGEKNTILGLYVSFAAVIGLLLPIAYIFEGIYAGDRERIKAAAPHLFLLASQVFMEGVSFWGNFSLPIRVFVPVFYNSKRIFTIAEWLGSEFSKVDEGYGGSTVKRLYVGRTLAAANMAFWCFNLFGFLLPVFLGEI